MWHAFVFFVFKVMNASRLHLLYYTPLLPRDRILSVTKYVFISQPSVFNNLQ